MSLSGRKRTSLVLLLVLAAGLALAGAAAATSAQDMACCPAGMESDCTWLGVADCCSERPTAPAPAQAATPAPAMCHGSMPPAVAGAPLALPTGAILLPSAARSLVLRL